MRHFLHTVPVSLPATDEQHAEEVGHVAYTIHIAWVKCTYAIDHHIICIEFRGEFTRLERPHALVVLHEICHTRCIVLTHRRVDLTGRKHIAGDLHFLCLRR